MVEMVQPAEGDLDLALNTTTLTATGPLLAYTSVGRNGDASFLFLLLLV